MLTTNVIVYTDAKAGISDYSKENLDLDTAIREMELKRSVRLCMYRAKRKCFDISDTCALDIRKRLVLEARFLNASRRKDASFLFTGHAWGRPASASRLRKIQHEGVEGSCENESFSPYVQGSAGTGGRCLFDKAQPESKDCARSWDTFESAHQLITLTTIGFGALSILRRRRALTR